VAEEDIVEMTWSYRNILSAANADEAFDPLAIDSYIWMSK